MADDMSVVEDAAPAAGGPPASIPSAGEAGIAPPSKDRPAESPADSLDDDLRSVFRKLNPNRDANGRYSASDDVDDADAADEAEKPATEETSQAPAEEPKSKREAPRSWSPEARAKWDSVDPDLQEYIDQREIELHQAKSNLGRMQADTQALREVFEGHREYLVNLSKATGTQVPQFLDRLIKTASWLDTDPKAAVKALASHYKVDLSEFYDPLATPPDPELVELRGQVQSLTERLQSQDRARAEAARREQQARYKSVAGEVESFFEKNPDAASMEDAIYEQLSAIEATSPNLSPAEKLKAAYERASWVDEKARVKRLNEAIAAREKEKAEAAKKAAKAASVNVTGSVQSEVGDDLDADLRKIYRKNNRK